MTEQQVAGAGVSAAYLLAVAEPVQVVLEAAGRHAVEAAHEVGVSAP